MNIRDSRQGQTYQADILIASADEDDFMVAAGLLEECLRKIEENGSAVYLRMRREADLKPAAS